MRPEQLQPRERKILALGLLLALLLVVAMGLIVPLARQAIQAQQAIADQSFRLERLQTIVARAPALHTQVAELEAEIARQGLTLHEESEALAAAGLQQQISDVVSRHGGSIQSTRVQPAVTDEGLQRISVRVQMRGDTATLAAILADLEAGQPLLFVDGLSVRAAREFEMVNRRRVAGYLGMTEISLDISAFWRPGAPAAGQDGA